MFSREHYTRNWRDLERDTSITTIGDMPTVYFSTAEAAEYLKVKTNRIVTLIDEGRFPGAVKINNRWQIPADEVIHFQRLDPGRPKKTRGRPRKNRT